MKVLVAGGGTGGHVYPALALVEELRRRFKNISIGYVGTARGLEARVVKSEPDVQFFEIDASGLNLGFSMRSVTRVLSNIKGLGQSLKVIAQFDPQIIIGTGGYVSFGPLLWGTLLKIPTLIHEQNRVPGLANQLLASRVDAVLTSFPETASEIRARRAVCTGLPLRRSILSIRENVDSQQAKESLNLDPKKRVVLVMGGTHGAQFIHEQLVSHAERMRQEKIELVILAGNDAERLQREAYLRGFSQLKILSHTPDVGRWMRAADVMICRAGGSTLAEMTALGVPSIVIPWPGAAHHHQEQNGAWLAERGACLLLQESDCHGSHLIDNIVGLLNDEISLRRLNKSCQAVGKPDATQLVLREVIGHLEHGKRTETLSLYRYWRRWNERLGVDLARAGAFRQRFGL